MSPGMTSIRATSAIAMERCMFIVPPVRMDGGLRRDRSRGCAGIHGRETGFLQERPVLPCGQGKSMQDQAVAFGPYRLDRSGLTARTRAIRLTPKSLALLRCLAERPGRVVTKDELFAAVWPDTTISDAALVTCIQEIRKALRDDARRPRYIETLHRRGYRFIATPAVSPAPPEAGDAILVDREEELAQLQDALARARAGQRQIVFVTGEPGIGKTLLVRAFVGQAAERGDVHVAWGQSAEHYGASEPHLPVLAALVRAGRRPFGDRLVRTLDQHAPTWLA